MNGNRMVCVRCDGKGEFVSLGVPSGIGDRHSKTTAPTTVACHCQSPTAKVDLAPELCKSTVI